VLCEVSGEVKEMKRKKIKKRLRGREEMVEGTDRFWPLAISRL